MDIIGLHIDKNLLFSTAFAGAIFVLVLIIRQFVLSRLRLLAAKTESKIDDYIVIALEKTGTLFLLLITLYISFYHIKFSDAVEVILDRLMVVILAVQIGKLGSSVLSTIIENYFRRKNPEEVETERATIGLLTLTAKAVFFVTLFLFVLHNLGINVTALVTGLGVGGIAIALAVQSILGDMIGSMSIIMDKPFVVGDYIVIDNLEGTVENIGLKTTRLRSLTGEQLILSNADLLKSRIKNLKRMERRRINVTLGVTYETNQEQLESIPQTIKLIVEAEPKVQFDRCFFLNYGPSSLDFELVYWILAPEVLTARQAQQSINLKIFKAFNEQGIQFAYPTQTLHMIAAKS